ERSSRQLLGRFGVEDHAPDEAIQREPEPFVQELEVRRRMRLILAQANPFQHCPRWVRDGCTVGQLPAGGPLEHPHGPWACPGSQPLGTAELPARTAGRAMFCKPPE